MECDLEKSLGIPTWRFSPLFLRARFERASGCGLKHISLTSTTMTPYLYMQPRKDLHLTHFTDMAIQAQDMGTLEYAPQSIN